MASKKNRNEPGSDNGCGASGIEANRKELEAVMRYVHEQGLVKHRLKFEELFHPSTLELKEGTA